MDSHGPSYRGRGADYNPPNQFEKLHNEPDPTQRSEQVETEYYRDHAQSILAENQSPDIPFTYSINPYRGCEHGCVYCYARPTHEYLGFSAGTDFESKIIVKPNAPELLREAFQKNSWTPQVISLSGNTDPYQPVEKELELTRRCLEVFREFRNPVSIITKNHLITRDRDLLAEMAERDLVSVRISITSLNRDLIASMEPRTSRPGRRLDALETLADAGVPVGVNAAPMIPGLTDEELPRILEAASERGATSAAYILVRLPGTVKEVFQDWVQRNYPDRADKILNQIRDTRDGKLNESAFGDRMKGEGEFADFLSQLFDTTCKKLGLNKESPSLTTEAFRQPPGDQRSLF